MDRRRAWKGGDDPQEGVGGVGVDLNEGQGKKEKQVEEEKEETP